MKTRKGFVSNSSSSSFILVGYEISKESVEKLREHDEDAYYEIAMDTNNFRILMGSEDGVGDKAVAGDFILDISSDDNYVEYDSFSLDDVSERMKAVKETILENGFEIIGEGKLFMGTRCT